MEGRSFVQLATLVGTRQELTRQQNSKSFLNVVNLLPQLVGIESATPRKCPLLFVYIFNLLSDCLSNRRKYADYNL